jgi:hypothetical protein
MAMPEQSKEPITGTILFDDQLPLNIPIVLGALGYDVVGATPPLTYNWYKNSEVIAVGEVAVIKAEAGNNYSVNIADSKNCSVTLPIQTEGANNNQVNSENLVVLPTIGGHYIHLKTGQIIPADAKLFVTDLKGIQHLQTKLNGETNIPLNLSPGVYLLQLTGKGLNHAEKFVVR